jgi:uncharacterized protein involved in exopolysaccharide biosynthesis
MSPARRFWLSRLLRRLPLVLAVFALVGGAALALAWVLPPTYAAQTQITVAAAQIPDRTVGPTDATPPMEQLQLFQQRLLTRANLLAIAAKLQVFAGQPDMSADEIAAAMTRATTITSVTGRDQATLMTIGFAARTPDLAAGVVNEYLTLILQDDARIRTDRARQTLDFFTQEVARLAAALDAQTRKLLAFKRDNAATLPENLAYMRQQESSLQDRLALNAHDVGVLVQERDRLVQVFASTGTGITTAPQDTPGQRQMADLQARLSAALAVYSRQNPRVKMLQAQIDQVQASIDAATAAQSTAARAAAESAVQGTGATALPVGDGSPGSTARALVALQLSDIRDRLAALATQKTELEARLAQLASAVAGSPATALALDTLQRETDALQTQYSAAVAAQAQAAQAARVAALSRGERITVLEQPAVPTDPVKPRRAMIAALGLGGGLAGGLALAVLLEMLGRTLRRPDDLVARLGITPLATLPYLPTRREQSRERAITTLAVLAMLAAVPLALLALDAYALPPELLGARLMSNVGITG